MSEKSRGGRFKNSRQRRRIKNRFLGFEQLEVRRLLTVEIEPNATPATATAFTANDTIEGKVLNVADVDYFKINVPYGSRLTVNTTNIRDARFDPTLPPPVEIIDGGGNLLASSDDGRDAIFTANKTADYFVRMDSSNAYGTVAVFKFLKIDLALNRMMPQRRPPLQSLPNPANPSRNCSRD